MVSVWLVGHFFYRHLLSQFLGGYGGLDPKSYGICLFILPGAWKIPGMPDFFDLCWEKMGWKRTTSSKMWLPGYLNVEDYGVWCRCRKYDWLNFPASFFGCFWIFFWGYLRSAGQALLILWLGSELKLLQKAVF